MTTTPDGLREALVDIIRDGRILRNHTPDIAREIEADILAPLLAERDAAVAERDEARKELAKVVTVVRSAAMGEWTDNFEAMVEESCAWEARVTTLTAENERLRAALAPFADYGNALRYLPPDTLIGSSHLLKRKLTMGECYTARAALATELTL